jgi:hypothetical protein
VITCDVILLKCMFIKEQIDTDDFELDPDVLADDAKDEGE